MSRSTELPFPAGPVSRYGIHGPREPPPRPAWSAPPLTNTSSNPFDRPRQIHIDKIPDVLRDPEHWAEKYPHILPLTRKLHRHLRIRGQPQASQLELEERVFQELEQIVRRLLEKGVHTEVGPKLFVRGSTTQSKADPHPHPDYEKTTTWTTREPPFETTSSRDQSRAEQPGRGVDKPKDAGEWEWDMHPNFLDMLERGECESQCDEELPLLPGCVATMTLGYEPTMSSQGHLHYSEAS